MVRLSLIFRSLERAGFTLFEQELDASEFGVPQKRRRLFIIGINRIKFPHIRVCSPKRTVSEPATVREALGHLPPPTFFRRDWYPLYAFIRRQGSPPPEAEDLTQEFFYRFLERDSLVNVRPTAGKFRSYMLACLKHFLVNEWERARAQRRRGGRPAVPLEAGSAETQYLLEPADNETPEVLFERRWAFTVLEQALAQLGRKYARRQQADLFEALQGFLPGGEGGVLRAEIAAKHGVSAGALDVAIHRLRQRFGAVLREQVAETVSSEAEVDDEIRHLISVLGA